MQLVYDVKEIVNMKTGEAETLKRFDTKAAACEYAHEAQLETENPICLVPVILNDDFTDPTELNVK